MRIRILIRVLMVLAFGAVCGTAPAQPAKAVSIRDLLRIVRLGDPQLSPDGGTVALVETRADAESDEYRTEVVLVDVARREQRALTRARHHADTPRWSPTGDRIAFLAPDADKVRQLYVMPMTGGEALQVTAGKDDVQQYAWSPDGLSFAYAKSDPKPELTGEARYRNAFRVGNDDYTISEALRPTHLWLIPATGGEARRLTSGSWSLPSSLPPGSPSSPVKWTPDGRSIVIVRQQTPSTGDQDQTSLQVVDVATGQMRAVTGDTTFEGYPQVSPDGTTIAYWRVRDGKGWNFADVWLAPLAGGRGRDISSGLDKNVFGTWWAADGESLVVGASVDTTVGLWRLHRDGRYEPIGLGATMPVNGYWIEADVGRDGRIAYVGQSKSDPYELYLVAATGGAPIALTHVNDTLSDLALARAETIRWKGPAGRELDGVLTYPAGFAAGRRYPLVLYIHGGPNASSREKFSLMPQALAAQGFVVFEPNYRGSDNRGNAFYAAIYKDAGQGPGEDVMSGVEYVKTLGIVDPARMAVTGWSYGGFMTTWLAGHYPVWKAVVAGAAVTDWQQMYDLSDGNRLIALQTGGSPYVGDGMAQARRQSPATYATKIRAPTLVMSNTGDFRVPATQSFALYHALRDNGVTTEFYAIPSGGHFPGDPIRQMDVYQRWIDWLVPYLKPGT